MKTIGVLRARTLVIIFISLAQLLVRAQSDPQDQADAASAGNTPPDSPEEMTDEVPPDTTDNQDPASRMSNTSDDQDLSWLMSDPESTDGSTSGARPGEPLPDFSQIKTRIDGIFNNGLRSGESYDQIWRQETNYINGVFRSMDDSTSGTGPFRTSQKPMDELRLEDPGALGASDLGSEADGGIPTVNVALPSTRTIPSLSTQVIKDLSDAEDSSNGTDSSMRPPPKPESSGNAPKPQPNRQNGASVQAPARNGDDPVPVVNFAAVIDPPPPGDGKPKSDESPSATPSVFITCAPAYEYDILREYWSCWKSMKDREGFEYPDLDWAYWQGGMGLPGGVRDFPTEWIVRNRSSQEVKLDCEIHISYVYGGTSGWGFYTVTIPAGKIVSGGKANCLGVADNRVINGKNTGATRNVTRTRAPSGDLSVDVSKLFDQILGGARK